MVEIDSETSVDLDFCVELTRYIEQHFDRDAEDYSLEIGSYSITKPFVDRRQYRKNIGRKVEVLTEESRKIRGTLVAVDNDGFTLEIEEKELLEIELSKKETRAGLWFSHSEVQKEARERYGSEVVVKG